MPDNFTLRQARNLAGITQAEMAKKLGVSRAMYRSYEQYLTLMRPINLAKLLTFQSKGLFFCPKVVVTCS